MKAANVTAENGERARRGRIQPAPSLVGGEAPTLTKWFEQIVVPSMAGEAPTTAPEAGALPNLIASFRLSYPVFLMFGVAAIFISACRSVPESSQSPSSNAPRSLQRVIVVPNSRGFVFAETGKPFRPWGLNYGNAGRLMEDFWEREWDTLASDFHEMRALGANVVRIHLQLGRFMNAPDKANPDALKRLADLLKLAERSGLYVDVTGLACYRTSDVPAWFDALDESARWTAQANFWEAVATVCAASSAVFCYDLMNEPISPGQRRQAGQWYSGALFGGYDFIQYIAIDPAGRTREEIARQWIRRMCAAIRRHDQNALITVGLLPWSRDWKHLSGFVPEKIAADLDFISVHLYPDTKKPGEALEALQQCNVGKPVVIEEIFPLKCSARELEEFMRTSRNAACGWIGHYDGTPLDELNSREGKGRLSIRESLWRDWLRLFVRLQADFAQ